MKCYTNVTGTSDLEERFGVHIDNLKEELVRNEKLLNETQRGIIEKETSLIALQTEYDKLEVELQSAKAQIDQDQILISKLEEDKNNLKDKVERIKAALEDDKTNLKQTINCILQNEALNVKHLTKLMKKIEQLQRQDEEKKRIEDECRMWKSKNKDLQQSLEYIKQDEVTLKEQRTISMQKIEQLQRQLRRTEEEKSIESAKAETLRQLHITEVDLLQQLVMKKEEECHMWKSKFKDLQQGKKSNEGFNRHPVQTIGVDSIESDVAKQVYLYMLQVFYTS